jgi:Protein of unknown function (DUF3616)
MFSMRFASRVLPVLVAACTSSVGAFGPNAPNGSDPDAAPDSTDAATPDGPLALDPTPGTYVGQCDGSGGVALDFTHFVSFSDADQIARIYARGATGGTYRTLDLSAALGLAPDDDADLEDATMIGHRIYVLGSHGRKNDGTLAPHRQRFAAIDVRHGGLSPAGSSESLLRDMLDATSWSTPDAGVIDALAKASQLDQQQVADLAPKVSGINIEGIAHAPLPDVPDRLVVGLRNPRPNGRAVAVSLMNADAVVAGAAARFGEATLLDLGGLGIRGMAWSDALAVVLIIAGPHDDAYAPFRLYRWSGNPGDAPELVMDLAAPANTKPEGIVTYPGTKDVQLVLDSDDVPTAGTTCDNAPTAARSFGDLIIHLD